MVLVHKTGLLNHRLPDCTPRVADSGLGWSLRICFSKFLGDVDAADQGLQAQNHWSRLCCFFFKYGDSPSPPMEKKQLGPRRSMFWN